MQTLKFCELAPITVDSLRSVETIGDARRFNADYTQIINAMSCDGHLFLLQSIRICQTCYIPHLLKRSIGYISEYTPAYTLPGSCMRYRTLSGRNFDVSRSRKTKFDGVIELSIYDFLIFNSKIWLI